MRKTRVALLWFSVSIMAFTACGARPLHSSLDAAAAAPGSGGAGAGDQNADGGGRAGSGGAGASAGGAGRAEDAGLLPGTGGRAGARLPADASVGTGGGPASASALPACGKGTTTDKTPGWIYFDSDRTQFSRDIYKIRPDGSDLTRVTSATGIEKEPSVSTDGARLAFTSDSSGSLQVYLKDLATGKETPVTNLAAGADQPRFSHDGKIVAFHSGAGVWLARMDGRPPAVLALGLDSFNAYFWPDFSVGDQELVFDRNNEINAIHLDGSGLRMIVANTTTTIKGPRVSPAGSELVYFVYCDSGLSIWTTSFTTKTEACKGRRVSPVGEPDSQRPAWGPNDVFAYERVNKATNVATIVLLSRTPGSVPCELTPGTSDNRNPTWSP